MPILSEWPSSFSRSTFGQQVTERKHVQTSYTTLLQWWKKFMTQPDNTFLLHSSALGNLAQSEQRRPASLSSIQPSELSGLVPYHSHLRLAVSGQYSAPWGANCEMTKTTKNWNLSGVGFNLREATPTNKMPETPENNRKIKNAID